jgi:hypothetical protein
MIILDLSTVVLYVWSGYEQNNKSSMYLKYHLYIHHTTTGTHTTRSNYVVKIIHNEIHTNFPLV